MGKIPCTVNNISLSHHNQSDISKIIESTKLAKSAE